MVRNLFFFSRKRTFSFLLGEKKNIQKKKRNRYSGKEKKPIAFSRKMKSGQLKIQQMAFMLIAVTLLFVLLGLFVMNFMFSDLRQTASELGEKNALLLVTRLANSPEFSCGDAFGSSGVNCIDADKVIMLRENIERYGEFWGVAEVKIRKVYPSGNTECTAGNYPDCDVITIYSEESNKGADYSNFVSLCRKDDYEGETYDKCELARLMVFPEVVE